MQMSRTVSIVASYLKGAKCDWRVCARGTPKIDRKVPRGSESRRVGSRKGPNAGTTTSSEGVVGKEVIAS